MQRYNNADAHIPNKDASRIRYIPTHAMSYMTHIATAAFKKLHKVGAQPHYVYIFGQ